MPRRGCWRRPLAVLLLYMGEAAALASLSDSSSTHLGRGAQVANGTDADYPWPIYRLLPPYGDGPYIKNQRSLRGFGAARYLDWPLPTWEDFQERGKLGATCSPGSSAAAQCGQDLVCRQGICRHCSKDSECPSMHRCAVGSLDSGSACTPAEQKAWQRAFTNPYEFLCTLAIFLASMLAAAAGTGGGGMFVPLLVSLSGLKAEQAVPTSQVMILCGSVVNLSIFLSKRHPEHREQPVIDYDCVVLLEPLLCLGVMCGVLINRMSPQWLLLLLLCGTLGFALWRTASKGVLQLRAELEAPPVVLAPRASAAAGALLAPSPSGAPGVDPRLRGCLEGLVSDDFMELTNKKAWQVILIVLVWLLMLACSFHGIPICSKRFAGFLGQLSALLFFSTYVAARLIRHSVTAVAAALAEAQASLEVVEAVKEPFDWTGAGEGGGSGGRLGIFLFPCAAFGAGFLGGLLGLGGGIIMSPMLLEVGLHSEAVQATTAVFVFLSSSLATIQFARLKQHVWHYALWYGAITVFATLLGQHLCEVFVRKTGRYSIITLSIAGVLFASLAALSVVGALQVAEDLYLGRQVWFSMDPLCNTGGLGIVAVDVVPAHPWPSDLPKR